MRLTARHTLLGSFRRRRPCGGQATRGTRSPARPRRGFSLVEIVVAIVMLSFMATGLTSYNIYVARSRIVAKQRALGLIAAQEAIDVVRSQPFDSIAVGTVNVVSTLGRIPLTVITNIELTQPNLKLVKVVVKNPQGKVVQNFITAVFNVH